MHGLRNSPYRFYFERIQMGKKLNLAGKHFYRLIAIKDSGRRIGKKVLWFCKCECGNTCLVRTAHLTTGKTKSCGCYKLDKLIERIPNLTASNTTHGHTVKRKWTPEYTTWNSMKERCYNSNMPNYKYYGGRGIFVCRRWRNSFENFLKDMGQRPENKTIDRINNNNSYGPWNCKWSTLQEQANNKRY